MISMIGKGGYSKVMMARKKDTGQLYAIKVITQGYWDELEVNRLLWNEPFVCPLYWAFQEGNEIFLVMDLCVGGQMFHFLNMRKHLEEQVAKFYVCEILIAIKAMHRKNIIYWDLKPENVLIDIDGHIKMSDFGLAKRVK